MRCRTASGLAPLSSKRPAYGVSLWSRNFARSYGDVAELMLAEAKKGEGETAICVGGRGYPVSFYKISQTTR